MNAKRNKTMKSCLMTAAGALLAVAAVVVVPKTLVKAQPGSTGKFQPFVAYGFRADASSPLILQGELIGNNAVWQVQFGPVESNTFAMFPKSTFNAGCHAEYSQVMIVANDGTLTLDLYATACGAYDPSGAASMVKKGAYSLVSATGRFEQCVRGTGDLSIEVHADGSETLQLLGVLRMPAKD